jgi:hypothetical protein
MAPMSVLATQAAVSRTNSRSSRVMALLLRNPVGCPVLRGSLRAPPPLSWPPLLHQSRAASRFPPPVGREAVHDAIDPGAMVSVGIELHEREQERVVDDFSGIFLGEPVSPTGSAYETDEERPVKLFQHWRRDLAGLDRHPPGRWSPGSRRHLRSRA